MVAVTTVESLDGYKLRLIFDDGSKRVVDLTADAWGPMGERLRDPAVFHQVRVDPELRTIVWPNGFDLDPDVLHGRSSQDVSPAAPAAGLIAARRTNVLPDRHPGPSAISARGPSWQRRRRHDAVRERRRRRTHRTRKGGVRRQG
jgi:Protein of unknown function (DUF2442)